MFNTNFPLLIVTGKTAKKFSLGLQHNH